MKQESQFADAWVMTCSFAAWFVRTGAFFLVFLFLCVFIKFCRRGTRSHLIVIRTVSVLRTHPQHIDASGVRLVFHVRLFTVEFEPVSSFWLIHTSKGQLKLIQLKSIRFCFQMSGKSQKTTHSSCLAWSLLDALCSRSAAWATPGPGKSL